MVVHRLILGDCLKELENIPAVDLVVTDPPYEFVSKNPRGGGFMKNENKKHLVELNVSFGMSFTPLSFLEEIKRNMKKFNLYVFTNKNLIYDYISFAKENNYKYDVLVWNKTNPVPIFKGHYLSDLEYILYISERGATFNSNLGYEKYFKFFSFPIGNRLVEHPTAKPLPLIEKYIEISSREGDIVLDPFLGSGTTSIACERLNRNSIGIENNEEYINLSYKRLKQEVEQLKFDRKKSTIERINF